MLAHLLRHCYRYTRRFVTAQHLFTVCIRNRINIDADEMKFQSGDDILVGFVYELGIIFVKKPSSTPFARCHLTSSWLICEGEGGQTFTVNMGECDCQGSRIPTDGSIN